MVFFISFEHIDDSLGNCSGSRRFSVRFVGNDERCCTTNKLHKMNDTRIDGTVFGRIGGLQEMDDGRYILFLIDARHNSEFTIWVRVLNGSSIVEFIFNRRLVQVSYNRCQTPCYKQHRRTQCFIGGIIN
ncbi:hypothetical protein FRX31_005846 [Thalictrum thalictroides]|uniref:Uncharacterized protein n=1 Tax=Thalictrum thalictroides TaxID=46969 RepID=A0A7J6X6R4_THATH|nr:hypothetical protein FRX31_005846 [Thalictrum thalictroides]